MRTIEKNLFTFEELSGAAQQKAIENYRRYISCDFSVDTEYIFDDAATVAALLGIEIATRGKNDNPVIYYSGFNSQGDGACFDGFYRYKKGALKAVKAYAPQDGELQRIAEELQNAQRKYFYKLEATGQHRGHYYHSGCMSVNVSHADNPYQDIGTAEDAITQCLRDFADWIYKQLENEWEYQNSSEAIREAILVNAYEFTEDGKIA